MQNFAKLLVEPSEKIFVVFIFALVLCGTTPNLILRPRAPHARVQRTCAFSLITVPCGLEDCLLLMRSSGKEPFSIQFPRYIRKVDPPLPLRMRITKMFRGFNFRGTSLECQRTFVICNRKCRWPILLKNGHFHLQTVALPST